MNFTAEVSFTVREQWIDVMRGLCMLCILFDHTELYYAHQNIVPYALYVPDALVCFFFLSGYLFYKGETFNARKKFQSICRYLLLPYLLFSSLMAFPKAFAHGENLSVDSFFLTILSGNASWFIPALILAECLFLLLLHFTHRLSVLFIFAFFGFFLAPYLQDLPCHFPWQLPNAVQALTFMIYGYVCRHFVPVCRRYFKRAYLLLPLLPWLVVKCLLLHGQVHILISPIRVGSYPFFFLTVVIAPLLFMSLTYLFRRFRCVAWVGRHSLVLCFLSGAVPLLVSRIFQFLNMPYNGFYYRVVLVFVVILLVAFLTAHLIHRFFPFLLGRKCVHFLDGSSRVLGHD